MGNPLEEEMLAKYLAQKFPAAQIWIHVRLGKLPDRVEKLHDRIGITAQRF